jgi:hypothetical protein
MRRLKLHDYVLPAKNIFIMGTLSVVSFFLLAAPIAKTMLLTNYGDIYSAYRVSNSILQSLVRSYNLFGLFWVTLFLSGAVYAIANKKTRWFSLFLIIQFISAFFLFSRVQDFALHHFYLLIPTMIFFITFFIESVYARLHNRFLRSVFLSGYIAMLFINFSVFFIPPASSFFQKIAFLLPGERHYPFFRNDMHEINKLLDFLENALQSGNDNVYVIASSSTFNDDILRNACAFGNHPQDLCKKTLPSSHVDKRDGFPSQFLDAKYVIVTNPVQYHLGEEDQRVIGILADQILSRRGIGSSYTKLPEEFVFDNNVKAFIYKKVTPFKKADLDNLSKLFMDYYPNKRNIFKINPICDSILKKEVGDSLGAITCQKDFIFIHPGLHKPSKLWLGLNKEYVRIKMVFAFNEAARIPLSCGKDSGEINLTVIADDKRIFQRYMLYTQQMNYEIEARNINILEFIVDNGENGPDCDWFTIKDIEAD